MVCSKKIKQIPLCWLVVILAGVASLLFLATANLGPVTSEFVTVEINGSATKAKLAKTAQEHYQGLSHRQMLGENEGLLFVFRDSSQKSFVMRDMNFPLDIIFISNDIITDVFSDLAPEGSQPEHIYQSSQPVNLVLEVNAGYSAKHSIKPGDRVKIY